MHRAALDLGEPSFDPLIKRKPMHDDAEFDITAMIDLVFMMNIYFLVTFLSAAAGEINLPSATHVAPLDADKAVIVTILGSLDGESVSVYLGDGVQGAPITDPEDQEAQVRAAVEQGAAESKSDVLIKAEKKVRLRELFRISSAAASVEGVKMHVAVTETDGP